MSNVTEYTITGEIRTKRLLGKDKDGKPVRTSALVEAVDLQYSSSVHVSIRLWPNTADSLLARDAERRAIEVGVSAESMDEAETRAFEALEWLSDFAAFHLQQPVYWKATQAMGGGRGRVGGLRSMFNPKFQSSAPMEVDINKPPLASIPLPPPNFSEKSLGALRWYHKGVAALYDLDKFISFWVALELLAPESKAKAGAYMRPRNCSCGDIEVCPKCGASTLYSPDGAGPQVTAMLVQELGLSKEEAVRLGKFRQLLHGAGRLTQEHSGAAYGLAKIAQKAASDALKRRLDLTTDDDPIVRIPASISATIDPVTTLPLE